MKTYNPKDVTVYWQIKNHTEDCATKKQVDMWDWVSKEDFEEYLNNNRLFRFAHTIGDCIGFHIEDNPQSEMKAKIYLMGEITYGIKNPDHVVLECDCDGDIADVKLGSDYTEDKFLTIGE